MPSETEQQHDVVIVLAHGSRAALSNTAHMDLCAAVGQRLDRPIEPAFLELAEPHLDAVVDAAVANSASHIVVVPLFLAPGNHVQRDVPALVAAASERHPDITIETTSHLGGSAGLIDLLAGLIADGLSAT